MKNHLDPNEKIPEEQEEFNRLMRKALLEIFKSPWYLELAEKLWISPTTEEEINELYIQREQQENDIRKILQWEYSKQHIALQQLFRKIEFLEKENTKLQEEKGLLQNKADKAWLKMRELEAQNAKLIDEKAQIKAQNWENSKN